MSNLSIENFVVRIQATHRFFSTVKRSNPNKHLVFTNDILYLKFLSMFPDIFQNREDADQPHLFIEREFPQLLNCDSDPHEAFLVPDSFLYGGIATKVIVFIIKIQILLNISISLFN